MSEYYSPDNLSQILPFLPRAPGWLLLGGPGDGREAQAAREFWPGVKVVGVEPNADAVVWQANHGWPEDAPLVLAALSDQAGRGLWIDHLPGSLRHDHARLGREAGPGREAVLATTTTWDALDRRYGPFEDAVLWLDVETHELEAVRGAAGLLARGAVLLANVEMQAQVPGKNAELDRLLVAAGMRAVHEWNASPQCWDRVYVLEG